MNFGVCEIALIVSFLPGMILLFFILGGAIFKRANLVKKAWKFLKGILYVYGVLTLVFTLVFIFGIVYTVASFFSSDGKNEPKINKVKKDDYAWIYEAGDEYSVGSKNVEEILYSCEEPRSFNGDGATYIKIKVKKDALTRIQKDGSKWLRGDELSPFIKSAADFALMSASEEDSLRNKIFTKSFYFFPIYIRAYDYDERKHCNDADFLVFDSENLILYYLNLNT